LSLDLKRKEKIVKDRMLKAVRPLRMKRIDNLLKLRGLIEIRNHGRFADEKTIREISE
jgi:hypothetical protein